MFLVPTDVLANLLLFKCLKCLVASAICMAQVQLCAFRPLNAMTMVHSANTFLSRNRERVSKIRKVILN